MGKKIREKVFAILFLVVVIMGASIGIFQLFKAVGNIPSVIAVLILGLFFVVYTLSESKNTKSRKIAACISIITVCGSATFGFFQRF